MKRNIYDTIFEAIEDIEGGELNILERKIHKMLFCFLLPMNFLCQMNKKVMMILDWLETSIFHLM